MPANIAPGLGELLRHLIELTDGAADSWYQQQGLNYRPRYTPIMRALSHGPASVTDIQQQLSVTQGAVSQTLTLMRQDGLIDKNKGEDARQSIICLTPHGQALLQELRPHWQATFTAIKGLENEIQLPLMDCLTRSVAALGKRSFADRTIAAKAPASSIASKQQSNPFHSGGERYSAFRPSYTSELAEALAALAVGSHLALDVGCGSGQLTSLLAPHFNEVVGIDPSESQLEHATAENNVTYHARTAEDTGLGADSVDLITVAQAAHWFDLEKFYSEARRVAKHDAAIALISYGVPYICDGVNGVFQQGYWQDIHEFWSCERHHVETGYADLLFPFPSIQFSSHNCREQMSVDQFINYITTWSAYANARAQNQQHRFDRFFERLTSAWQNNPIKEIVWPVSVKAGRIQKSAD